MWVFKSVKNQLSRNVSRLNLFLSLCCEDYQ